MTTTIITTVVFRVARGSILVITAGLQAQMELSFKLINKLEIKDSESTVRFQVTDSRISAFSDRKTQ